MRKYLNILIFGLIAVSFLSFSEEENTKIYGSWMSPNKDLKIKIFKATDGKIYGKFIWFQHPNGADGTPKKDFNNPVKSKRDTPLMDMVFLRSFNSGQNNKWENGSIYNPKTGKTYSCILTLEKDNVLSARAYFGFTMLGKTAVFTKVE